MKQPKKNKKNKKKKNDTYLTKKTKPPKKTKPDKITYFFVFLKQINKKKLKTQTRIRNTQTKNIKHTIQKKTSTTKQTKNGKNNN